MPINSTATATFAEIRKLRTLPDYLEEICLLLEQSLTDKKQIEQVLLKHDIFKPLATVEFLHLIIAYIKLAIEDEVLTNQEKQFIRQLKTLFGIRPGDFQLHNKPEIEQVIALELYKIYKDNKVTPAEALFKTDLQEVFDLSFDEMNEYAKKEAVLAVHRGADPMDLDIFLTNKEYFKWKSARTM